MKSYAKNSEVFADGLAIPQYTIAPEKGIPWLFKDETIVCKRELLNLEFIKFDDIDCLIPAARIDELRNIA